MAKKILSLALCLSMVVGLLSVLGALQANAAEDVTAPELVNIEIMDTEIDAGQHVEVKITVRESETGLARAMVQFNHNESGNNNEDPIHKEDYMGTPLYSNGESLIEYTFTLPTSPGALGGQWHIAYLQLYDAKGNYSIYSGSASDNMICKTYPTKEVRIEYVPYLKINQSNTNSSNPVIHSVSIKTPTVEKPGVLLLELEATLTADLSYAYFNLAKEGLSDQLAHMAYQATNIQGNVYTFEIPIAENRHLGAWQVCDIYLYDVDGRNSHYTNQIVPGYFVNYNNPADKHSLLTFTISGMVGDETKPTFDAIRVLNDNQIVEKPGVLKVAIDITEEQSGVVGLRIEYERIDGTESNAGDYYGAFYFMDGYGEEYVYRTPMDGPLMTGTHVIEMPVFSTKPAGKYKVTVTMLRDAAENSYEEYMGRGPSAEFTIIDEFEYAFEYGIANPNLLTAIQGLGEGEVGRIMLSGDKNENILTKEMLDAIAGQKKTLVCYMDGYQWIFEGKKINEKKTKDLNLTMRIAIIPGQYLSSGKDAICLSFENNGDLPGPVEFRFKSAFIKEFFGKEDLLYLFHVEGPESGHEKDIDYKHSDYKEVPRKQVNFKVVMEEKDAWCYVNLHHNSKYVVSDAPIVKYSGSGNTTQNTTPPATQPSATVPPTTAPGTTAPLVLESVPTTGLTTEGTTVPVTETITDNAESSLAEEEKPDNTVIVVIASVLGVAIAVIVGVLIYKHYKKK